MAAAKKPRAAAFPCGHKRTPDNLLIHTKGKNPCCRECHRTAMRERTRRKAAEKAAAAWSWVPKELRR